MLRVGIPLVTFLVFEQWFLVPMPKGPLEAWLGLLSVGFENLFLGFSIAITPFNLFVAVHRHHARHHHRRAARAWAAPTAWPSCCR